MNCALELAVMKKEAEIIYEEELERERERRRIIREKAKERTIKFCEEVINPALIETAKERKNFIIYKFGTDSDYQYNHNTEYLYLLEKDKVYYADGRASYSKNEENYLHKETLIKYLNQFCFTIKEEKAYYSHFGSGELIAINIIISFEENPCK